MMRFHSMVMIILLHFAPFISPTTINGRFTILQEDSSKFSVLIQINTNTGTDDLGGATFIFNFDTSSICFPDNPIKDVDYIFHNFDGENYSSATVTRPIIDQVWINIDLPFNNSNNGTVVSASPVWTDVATIHFDIIDPNGNAGLLWLSNSLFWGIYDADNSTLWNTGQFEDLNDPLPVELVAFNATIQADRNILLEWKTASSINNYGFEIEKSYDTSDLWEKMGFILNQGDPHSLTEYSFIDTTDHNSSIIKYRLKSIDNDGSFEYSFIIEVNIGPAIFSLSQNYPNPFNPSTKIRYTIPYGISNGSGGLVHVILKIYDVLGNEVAILVDEEKETGVY